MIIGSHGVGWLPANYHEKPKTRFFGGTTLEYQTDISTLTQSIKNANMQMQYIMFDDCYMSTIEVAYDLREVTHYLIGCTSEIMAYGMPYNKMWKELSSISPNYQQITDIFYNFYSNYNTPLYADYLMKNSDAFLKNGTMEKTADNYIRLTRKGLYISDNIMAELVKV